MKWRAWYWSSCRRSLDLWFLHYKCRRRRRGGWGWRTCINRCHWTRCWRRGCGRCFYRYGYHRQCVGVIIGGFVSGCVVGADVVVGTRVGDSLCTGVVVTVVELSLVDMLEGVANELLLVWSYSFWLHRYNYHRHRYRNRG